MANPTWTTPRSPLRHAVRSVVAVVGTLATVTTLVTTVVSLLGLAAAPASAANWASSDPNDFPDPSVLHWNGAYYAFGTQGSVRNAGFVNVQVATSSDGVHWAPEPDVDALPTLPPWAKAGNTWAPSVAYDSTDNRFVMYYVATEASTGDQCIGVATAPAADPTGPYRDSSAVPAVCQNSFDVAPTVDNGDYGGSIDPDVFTDSNGNSWLLWKSDGNHLDENAIIWSVPLSSNLLTPTSTVPTQLLGSTAAWQDGVIEGPDMVENQGTYDLFYAGNDVYTSSYAIGWASCPSGPSGPCQDQSTASPWFGTSPSSPGMSGPGGPDVYHLASGQLALAFAAWQGNTVGYANCGWRAVYVADLTLPSGGGAPSLTPAIDGPPAPSPFCPLPPPPPPGYWQVASDGGVFSFGGAQFYGSTGSIRLNEPVVGVAATSDDRGYWLVASDGGVFAFGDAGFYGSTGSIRLNQPVVAMIPTSDGHGYWLFARDGGVFAFGDAPFYGSAGGAGLAFPVTAAARAPDGNGYFIVDSNGQVYTYGDAAYKGGPSTAPYGFHIVGMALTPSGGGYWLASANGDVSDYGNAPTYGSALGIPLNAPIVGMAPTSDGGGYWLQGADGGIFTFGDAPFLGSMGGQRLNAPMVGIMASS